MNESDTQVYVFMIACAVIIFIVWLVTREND